MSKFGLLGLGYIANRHLTAIESTGHQCVLTYSPENSNPQVNSEKEFFELAKKKQLDYITICSPSYLHAEQIKAALLIDCNVIVEKPVCLTMAEWNEIYKIQQEKQKQVYTLFQLRYHPIQDQIKALAEQLDQPAIQLKYRGNREQSYFASWN